MAFIKRDNSGALFKNKDKDPSNPETLNYSDYQGTIKVAGITYWINAWLKEGAQGKFMSLSVRPQGQKPAAPRPAPKDEFDDEIPF